MENYIHTNDLIRDLKHIGNNGRPKKKKTSDWFGFLYKMVWDIFQIGLLMKGADEECVALLSFYNTPQNPLSPPYLEMSLTHLLWFTNILKPFRSPMASISRILPTDGRLSQCRINTSWVPTTTRPQTHLGTYPYNFSCFRF